MRRSSGDYGDSLEMLLDTMCNVLGGIIFITLTLSLMVGATPSSAPDPYEEQARQLTSEVAAVTRSNALVQAEIQQTLQRLQSPQQIFPTNRMRLPAETERTKTSWEVIVHHGKLFPVHLLSNTARDGKAQNSQSVEWQPAAGKSAFVVPRPDQGQSPEICVSEMVQTFRAAGKTNYYFVFWVYEDSFGEFNLAKETAASLGFQYGWAPVTQNTRLKIGERGESIRPQN